MRTLRFPYDIKQAAYKFVRKTGIGASYLCRE